MKNCDVISKYLESLHAGTPDEQAQLFARSWAQAMDVNPEIVTQANLKIILDGLMAKIDAKFYVIMALGGAIFVVCCLPILGRFFK